MTRKEFIEFYEEELQKLEKHREDLLEIDKNTTYIDKKIYQIEDLLSVLRSCDKSEMLKEENIEYRRAKWSIEIFLNTIERLKAENSKEVEASVIGLLEYLKKFVEEENQ